MAGERTDKSWQTRMQILTSEATPAATGVLRSTYQIASKEGVLNLWRGMSSVIVGAGQFPTHQMVALCS
jgi:hypothetical protein